jgi:DNA repair protein REV1
MADDNPHSYLTKPEYAPNRFGDIGDYMRKKEIKVQTQNRDIALASAEPGTSPIFNGLSFYINGNTHPPMEELRKMILQRGGVVYPVLRSKGMVKFIIAPMLTQMKFKQFKNYRVVKEGWITESCKEGKLLDWSRWKLQVEGGWEAEGRKGIEGFLRGEGSQRRSTQVGGSEEDEEASSEEEEIEVKADSRSILGTGKALPPEQPQSAIKTTPVTPTLTAATQSLISSSRPPEPVAGSARQTDLLSIDPTTPKLKRPEGPWENYYTKESNEHASEALRNADWRIKNTAERGNEGGFIDGYYQNSRYVN